MFGIPTRVLRWALALALVTSGCAEERAAINKVQADALEKSFFVGALADPSDDPEFYFRSTVVDVAAGAGADGLFTNSDAQPVSRVRWEITEDLLLARLSYERIDDTDGKGVRRTPDGQIVAAYRIESHFDIKKDYNPSTGEELNVIVENDEDRRWYERAFFRVDWSRNLVTDAYELDALSQLGIYYGVKWDPIAYYVNDPAHPHAPVFDKKRGYFDVTHKVWASPEVLEDEWGTYPACWLYGRFPSENCNPSEITLRQAFLRVEDTDYEPLEYDGTKMDQFGVFTVDRFGYDRSYGVVDDKWRRFATRWNLFSASHTEDKCNTEATTPLGADPNRDDNGNGTADECEVVGFGSRCDAVRGQCTIPYRGRPVRTIVWHTNREFPDELFEGTQAAFEAWSNAMRVGVIAARLAECRRTGEANCEGTLGWPASWADDWAPPVGDASPAEVPKVFVLCHNPVSAEKGDDLALCGEAGTSPRIGDLRYNLVNVIQDPQLMSPWGIMMDAEDPLTGEKIAGSVSQWGAVLDRAAASLADILALLNGEIDPEAFITGQDVSFWVQQNQPGGVADHGPAMSKAELQQRRAAYDPKVLTPWVAGLPKQKPNLPPAARRKAREEALSKLGRLGPGNAALSARLGKLRGSAVESRMVSPELAQAVGADPTAPVGASVIERASPVGRLNPNQRRARLRARRLADVRRHACRYEAAEPDHLIGMARAAAKLFPKPDPADKAAVAEHRKAVELWARQEYSRGVMSHEIGHSVGLRHNFAASFDALNYAAEYWQLRTKDGTVTTACADGTTDGANCIGPRWRDPISDAEIDGNIGRYSTSSVMDYPGDQNQDMVLPGKYDRAAARFIYGGVVDVWAKSGVSVSGSGGGQSEAYLLSAFTTSPGLFGVYYFPKVDPAAGYEFIHYSDYQQRFGLISGCTSDAQAPLGTRCVERAMDVVDYRDMQDFASDPDYAGYSWAVNAKAIDGSGRVRRGYLFSSDEYADTGNVPAFSSDAGADAYEQIRFLESAYENRYLLDSFRRNRVEFNSYDTMSRVQYRYLDKIQLIAKTFAFGAVLDGDPSAPSAEFLQDGLYGSHALGATVALDLFARIMTRPEPGYYCPAEFCGAGQPPGVTTDLYNADPVPLPDVFLYDFRMPLGTGRYLHNDYDYSQGYWWGDYQSQVGSYYDKIWATYYLAEAFDTFIASSKEDFVDSRYKNVSFATVFPEQVRRLYTNVLTGDLDVYAPHATAASSATETPLGTLAYPTWSALGDLGTRPAGAFLVDPNNGWNEQLYAMVWGAAFFPTNWSSRWAHEAKIAVLPAEMPDWPANEVVAFSYPPTGLTYRARSYGLETLYGKTVDRGVGARMLHWANHLLTLAYVVDRDTNGAPILGPDGRPTLTLDTNGNPQLDPNNSAAVSALGQYVDFIDMMRQVTATFELPLSGGDLPDP
ncbi:MAG: zinc-dependent metalloprotease [Polyangiaceae bacterium]